MFQNLNCPAHAALNCGIEILKRQQTSLPSVFVHITVRIIDGPVVAPPRQRERDGKRSPGGGGGSLFRLQRL